MPTYKFYNSKTKEEFVEFMGISAMEQYLADNPHLSLLVSGAPMIHSGRGLKKPDPAFRDLLKEIKKKHSKGITKSSINDF